VYRLEEEEEKDVDTHYRHMTAAVGQAAQLVSNADSACLFLVGLPPTASTSVLSRLSSLSHWQGDGRNHLLINTVPVGLSWAGSPPGRYMMAQQQFTRAAFRPGFDFVLPGSGSFVSLGGHPVRSDYPSLMPIAREYLLYFSGDQNISSSSSLSKRVVDSLKEDSVVVEELKKMQTASGTRDRFHFIFSCGDKNQADEVPFTDWNLCGESVTRLADQAKATFSLVLPPSDQDLVSTHRFQVRLYEALKASTQTARNSGEGD
jgi:hypothetical protein